MKIDAFDFDLPEANIALRPAEPRDSARLLQVDGTTCAISDHTVLDLPDLLQPDDLLVFNDTRVIPARLDGVRERDGTTAKVSCTLHMREAGDTWRAFAQGAKKLRQGDRVAFAADFSADVLEKGAGGEIVLRFDRSGPELDAALVAFGSLPLPPYIASKRAQDERDRRDYQTVYARHDGAVAAPTAGLHFTDRLFAALDARGVQRTFVTLHVGAGTFLPVKVDDTDDHRMHSEWGEIASEAAERIAACRQKGGRVIAVGTTSLRLLESAAADGDVRTWSGATDIFIQPGYRFRAVDGLMTNFHLPKSTLFMLVSALCGLETMRSAYAHAISNKYRFYSYGDSSLLWPAASAQRVSGS